MTILETLGLAADCCDLLGINDRSNGQNQQAGSNSLNIQAAGNVRVDQRALQNDPDYLFRLGQGMRAIETAALASIGTAPPKAQDAAHGIYFRQSCYASREASPRKGNE